MAVAAAAAAAEFCALEERRVTAVGGGEVEDCRSVATTLFRCAAFRLAAPPAPEGPAAAAGAAAAAAKVAAPSPPPSPPPVPLPTATVAAAPPPAAAAASSVAVAEAATDVVAASSAAAAVRAASSAVSGQGQSAYSKKRCSNKGRNRVAKCMTSGSRSWPANTSPLKTVSVCARKACKRSEFCLPNSSSHCLTPIIQAGRSFSWTERGGNGGHTEDFCSSLLSGSSAS
mmetsp:Transcript_133950/g.334369  ORF Transcript_133950/g.334369 Transcript_133950/m.334369 type:complete len:229 (-) Transcript_133950:52-738(-)